jgi:corrinoid protein of di/trimethylamine methyltransferase
MWNASLPNEEILARLDAAVEKYDEDAARTAAEEAVRQDIDPALAIKDGLMKGLLNIGGKWAKGEAFITEVMLAANAFKAGLDILEPKLTQKGKRLETLGKVVMGTVQGDIHDIGKSIVAAMLKATGFEVQDLGVDVPSEKFVEAVKKYQPHIVGMSALLTTSMLEQRKVVDELRGAGLRDKVKIIVGGAPVTKAWAEEIGADAYGEDAFEAVNKTKLLVAK